MFNTINVNVSKIQREIETVIFHRDLPESSCWRLGIPSWRILLTPYIFRLFLLSVVAADVLDFADTL